MPASICWRRSQAGRATAKKLAAAAAKAGVATAADDTGAISSAGFWPSGSILISASGAPQYYMSTRCRWRRWRGRKPGSDKVAERFELYACGVELANAFGELTDVAEQRARFETAMAEKQRIHGERYPVDEDFLAALAAMPQASRHRARLRPAGNAGDGRKRIEQVIWTPVVDPE